MNYRHAYHAGNFADVLKHLIVSMCISHLKRKPAPFRVIDTHAGAGWYDLSGSEASRTGEWRAGIGRLMAAVGETADGDRARLSENAAIAEYLAAVAACNAEHAGRCAVLPGTAADGKSGGESAVRCYPGSPALIAHLMRENDRLFASELHREDYDSLANLMARDRRVKVSHIDGWTALKSLLPPKERRGLVLIDPPFEAPGEFGRIAEGVRAGLKRFATGIYAIWYPIKDARAVAAFKRDLSELHRGNVVSVELFLEGRPEPGVLYGCGVVVINPPFTLVPELQSILPPLARLLARGDGARGDIAWLSREA